MRRYQPELAELRANRDELRTWQRVFDVAAKRARDAGRKAAEDAIGDEFDQLAYHMPTQDRNRRELELIRLVEGIEGDAFAKAVSRKVAWTAERTWGFTVALVVEPLWPEASARVRREFSEGFYEALPLDLIEDVGKC